MAAVKELIVKITTNAKDAIKQIKEFGKGTKEAGKDADKASEDVEEYTETVKEAGDESNKAGKKASDAGKNVEKMGESSKKAKNNTSQLTDKVKGMLAPLEDVKKAMGAITGILGAFGISMGISTLIEQIKTIKEEADAARESIIKIHQAMTYQYNLSADQKQIVANLASTANAGLGYAGDAEDLTKIVGSVSNLNAGASLEDIQKLSETYMYLAERGIGSLDSTVKEANILFDKFGVSIGDQSHAIEYLSSVSEKALIPLDTFITLMQTAAPIAEKYGLSLEQMASVIGESTLKNAGSTKEIENFINTYGDVYSKFIEEQKDKIGESMTEGITDSATKQQILSANEELITQQATKDAETYMEQYSATMLSLVNTEKYAVNPLESGWNIVNANRSEADWEAAKKNSQLLAKYNSKSVEGTKPYYTEQIQNLNGGSMTGASGTIPVELDIPLLEDSIKEGTELVDGFINDGTKPLTESVSGFNGILETNYASTVILNDYTTGTLIPTMVTETGTVDNLTQAYIALANAKKAAGAA